MARSWAELLGDEAAGAAQSTGGVEWRISYNKGSVMVLPAGVTKGRGLSAALEMLGVSPHNVAAIGDAENDHDFLRICEVAGAVGNALPAIKERADIILRGRQATPVEVSP